MDQLDWKSIHSTDWSDNNPDNDIDRMRKKHSEFLVKDHVPAEYIKGIIVYTEARRDFVQNLLNENEMAIPVHIDREYKYYYR